MSGNVLKTFEAEFLKISIVRTLERMEQGRGHNVNNSYSKVADLDTTLCETRGYYN